MTLIWVLVFWLLKTIVRRREIDIARGVARLAFNVVSWRLPSDARAMWEDEVMGDVEQAVWTALKDKSNEHGDVAVEMVRGSVDLLIHGLGTRSYYLGVCSAEGRGKFGQHMSFAKSCSASRKWVVEHRLLTQFGVLLAFEVTGSGTLGLFQLLGMDSFWVPLSMGVSVGVLAAVVLVVLGRRLKGMQRTMSDKAAKRL